MPKGIKVDETVLAVLRMAVAARSSTGVQLSGVSCSDCGGSLAASYANPTKVLVSGVIRSTYDVIIGCGQCGILPTVQQFSVP